MSETHTLKMNVPMKPLQSSSVASRCICGLCGKRPEVSVTASDTAVTITARCCGRTENRTVTKEELLHTQRFFVSTDDGDDAA